MDKIEFQSLIKQIQAFSRPLEKARINHLFFGADAKDVINELAHYQNLDGGFGHALEPDLWNPNSSPIQTWLAIVILRSLPISSDYPMINLLLKYLESSFDEKTKRWPRLDLTNDLYPHAPWWSYRDESPDFNPSASIAGFIVLHTKPDCKLHKNAMLVIEDVLSFLQNTIDPIEVHELRSIIDMANDLNKGNRSDLITHDIVSLIIFHMNLIIEKDSTQWFTSYSVKPSALIKRHPSIGSDIFTDLMLKELDLAMKSRNNQGIWPITWSWNDYPEAFIEASKMWIGIIGFEYLELMEHYGIIQK